MFSTASFSFQAGCATAELQKDGVCVWRHEQEQVCGAAFTPQAIKRDTKHGVLNAVIPSFHGTELQAASANVFMLL